MALLLTTGCGRGSVASPFASPAPVSEFRGVEPGARLYYDDGSGLTDRVQRVIRDEGTWADVWRQITSNQATPTGMPSVDFTREMLLLVGAGRMNPGDEIKIDSVGVDPKDKTISVIVRTIIQCRPFPGESHPLEIVRLLKSENRVVWLERSGKPGCV